MNVSIYSDKPDAALSSTALTHWIEFYIRQHEITHPFFTLIGASETFQDEIDCFKEAGWKDNQHSEQLTNCLLINLCSISTKEINDIVDRYPLAQIVLVQADSGSKKTPYLAMLEAKGFRILKERNSVTLLSKKDLEIHVLSANLKLGTPEVKSALQQSWCRIRNLPESTSVDLLSVDPRILLVHERFDIAIKAHYARLYRDGLAPTWREYAYREQVTRITGPDQNICEHDGSGKSGIEQFTSAFHHLLKDGPAESIPTVPVDNSWIAFDGAHRIAAAIVMERDIHIARIHARGNNLANANFFADTSSGHAACPTEIIDEAAIEYCRIKSGLVLAMIFPTVASEASAIEELEQVGKIVYRKDILLTPAAGIGLLRQAYLGHAWSEDISKGSGFMHKVKSCFPFSGVVRVILLDGCEPSTVRPVKERIRAHYSIGNHSIHIADGDDEVLRMACVLFNDNSIELLRLGLGTLPGFHSMLFSFRDWIENNNLDAELFCIDGSAVLSLLGLRECRDLDFLFHGNPKQLPETPKRVDCHNKMSDYHCPIADIIGDPRLHCWYMGIKFCLPRTVLEMKERRGENKDFIDVGLLRSKLPPQQSRLIRRLKSRAIWMRAYSRIRFVVALNQLKKPLRPLVHTIRKYRGKK